MKPKIRHLAPGRLVALKGHDVRSHDARHWIHTRHLWHDKVGVILKYPAANGVWGLVRVMCCGRARDLFIDCVQPLTSLSTGELLARGPPDIDDVCGTEHIDDTACEQSCDQPEECVQDVAVEEMACAWDDKRG